MDQLRTEFRRYIKTKVAQELIDFYLDSLNREEVLGFFERQVRRWKACLGVVPSEIVIDRNISIWMTDEGRGYCDGCYPKTFTSLPCITRGAGHSFFARVMFVVRATVKSFVRSCTGRLSTSLLRLRIQMETYGVLDRTIKTPRYPVLSTSNAIEDPCNFLAEAVPVHVMTRPHGGRDA